MQQYEAIGSETQEEIKTEVPLSEKNDISVSAIKLNQQIQEPLKELVKETNQEVDLKADSNKNMDEHLIESSKEIMYSPCDNEKENQLKDNAISMHEMKCDIHIPIQTTPATSFSPKNAIEIVKEDDGNKNYEISEPPEIDDIIEKKIVSPKPPEILPPSVSFETKNQLENTIKEGNLIIQNILNNMTALVESIRKRF